MCVHGRFSKIQSHMTIKDQEANKKLRLELKERNKDGNHYYDKKWQNSAEEELLSLH